MVGVKEAVQTAATHLAHLVGVPQTVLLEEVERARDDGKSYWNVTLSYPTRPGVYLGESSVSAMFAAVTREYKIIQIDAETGELEAMKMKTLAR